MFLLYLEDTRFFNLGKLGFIKFTCENARYLKEKRFCDKGFRFHPNIRGEYKEVTSLPFENPILGLATKIKT